MLAVLGCLCMFEDVSVYDIWYFVYVFIETAVHETFNYQLFIYVLLVCFFQNFLAVEEKDYCRLLELRLLLLFSLSVAAAEVGLPLNDTTDCFVADS